MRLLAIFISYFSFVVMCQVSLCGLTWTESFSNTNQERLIVGGDSDYPPYDFLDDDGNPAGYCVDLVHAIADTMGFEVIIELGNWSEMRAKLERGEIDVLLGMLSTEDRDEHLDFSPPHSIVHHSIFVREQQSYLNTLEKLSGQEVIVIKHDIMHEFAIEHAVTDHLVVVDDQIQALSLLASGQHDAALLAYLPAMYWVSENGLTHIEPVGPTMKPYRYCFAVQQGNLATLSKFTEGLAILKESGEYQAIYERWLGVLEPESHIIFALQLLLVSLLLCVMLALLWVWQLKRMVEKRTLQLKESEERFRRLAEHAPDIIFRIILPEGRYEYVSPAVKSLLGYQQLDFYENPCFIKRLVHPNDQAFVNQQFERKTKGENVSNYEYRVINRFGETRWVHQRNVCLREANSKLIVVEGIITDITDIKEKERQHIELEKKILQAQKYKSLGILAGGVAHDFNNLLMTIMGNADLGIQELSKYSPVSEYFNSIIIASRRAADLCHQMLAYSGKGQFVIRPIYLNEMIEEMTGILRASISENIILRYNTNELSLPIEGDATQIRQIVMNLVTNAAEAIGGHSGVISLTTGSINCSEEYLDGTILAENLSQGVYSFLEVTDTGSGMSKEVINKIFDPFFTTKFAGRGLGMAAVLGIIRGHRGAIKIYSEPNRGTTIKCMFPTSNQSHPLSAELEEPLSELIKPIDGYVLLVDDEESIRSVGKEMLQLLGYSVITVSDGREALDVYHSHQAEIVLVILDLTMPTMDGENCFRALRQIDPNVKVIFSSGYHEHEIKDKFAARGYLGFIQKPYTLEHLKEKFREIENFLV